MGALEATPSLPTSNFCLDAFNFGAALLCVGDFPKSSLTQCGKFIFDWGS